MITVYCINRYGKQFIKVFDSYWQARVFILRCMHGTNVYVEGVLTDNLDCDEELNKLLSYRRKNYVSI